MWPTPNLSPKRLLQAAGLPARSKFQGGKRLWPCNPPQALLRSLTSDKRKGKVGLRALAGWLWISHLQNGSLSENSRPVDSQQQQLSVGLEDGVIVCVFNNIILALKGFWHNRGRNFRTLPSSAILMLLFILILFFWHVFCGGRKTCNGLVEVRD